MPYCGKRFWIHQIPTSCLPTLLIFIHIEHTFCICPFLVAFFSATIDGRNLIFGHKLYIGTPYRGKRFWTRQIPTSCLPKSGGTVQLTAYTDKCWAYSGCWARLSIFADGLLINPKVINRAIKYLVSSVLLISQVIYR